MNLEQRQEALEGEMLAAKDTIWRLTTRVVHLEKEVKDLKIVLKYAAKGFITPRPAKAAEIARLKRNKKPASKLSQAFKSDSVVTSNSTTLQTTNFETSVKAEPVSEDESNDENEQSILIPSADPNISIGTSSQTLNYGKRMFEELLETSDSSEAEGNENKTTKPQPRKIQKLSSVPGDGSSKRQGRRVKKDPAWDHFTGNADSKKKDSTVSCKTCQKVFNWPKIERLRAHLAICNTSVVNKYEPSNKTVESNRTQLTICNTSVLNNYGPSSKTAESISNSIVVEVDESSIQEEQTTNDVAYS